AVGGRDQPAGGDRRLGEYAGDRLGALVADGALDLVGALQRAAVLPAAEHAPVRVRRAHVDEAAGQRLERAARVAHVAARSVPGKRAAVIAVIAHDRLELAAAADVAPVLACEPDR